MSITECAERDVWLTRLANHLEAERYGCCAPSYRLYARRFLSYLQNEGLSVQTVQPSDVAIYLNTLRTRNRSDSRARPSKHLRGAYRSAVHMLLRLVRGQWPPAPVACSVRERFHAGLIDEYDTWMRDLRGLAATTRSGRRAESRRFLEWLAERGTERRLGSITVADMDAYVEWRALAMSRRGLKSAIGHLRGFLRHLHRSGRITDIGAALISPRVYTLEGIPSAFRAEDIDKVLRHTRRDRRPIGLRDFAMLLLLSNYGLRAGEVVTLQLKDIDWEHDRLTIRHSKTGVCSDLPLLKAPGEAILDYLRRGRPKTNAREVFVRATAPYRAFRSGGGLYAALQERLKCVGVTPLGKRGPHAFRHARAVSLLKRDTPLKVIGDVLGHRSIQSTMAYLKLDSEALRGVALEIPGVAP
jgi:integrase/recombinase XerD